MIGPLGCEPWGNPWVENDLNIQVADGFAVEKLYDVPAEMGSWVCICKDGSGGFYVSDEKDRGIFRITISAEGKIEVAKYLCHSVEPKGFIFATEFFTQTSVVSACIC